MLGIEDYAVRNHGCANPNVGKSIGYERRVAKEELREKKKKETK